jgi:hypothetical protein
MSNQEKAVKDTVILLRSTESIEEGQLPNVTGGVIIQEIISGATVLGKRTASEAHLPNYQSGPRKVRLISENG